MSITVEGVPETITREAYNALVAGAGFDVKQLRSLEFRSEGVYAEVLKTGPRGGGMIATHPDGDEIVTERVFVRVEG